MFDERTLAASDPSLLAPHGHQAGDEVLESIAETALQRVRRAPDVLGRYGDDEMLAVLPATSGGDAAILADCIRRDIESLALAHPASEHGVVTVSLGVVAEEATNRGSNRLAADRCRPGVEPGEGGRPQLRGCRRTNARRRFLSCAVDLLPSMAQRY